jgi:hypothetical protein
MDLLPRVIPGEAPAHAGNIVGQRPFLHCAQLAPRPRYPWD